MMARTIKGTLSVLLIVTDIFIWATNSEADPVTRKIDGVHLTSAEELQTELSRSGPLNLTLLEIENIHFNDESSLPLGLFKGSNISQLILRNIALKEINESLFDGLQDSLESIAFVGIQIKQNKTSHLNMFSGFKKLKTIIMTRSSTSLFKFTGDFRRMKGVPLIRIMMTVGKIAYVPYGSLENFGDTLEELILEGCLITGADKNWYGKTTMKALRRLNLSSNRISSLNTGFFDGMPALKELDLQDNYFSLNDAKYAQMFDAVDLTYLGLYDTDHRICERNIDWLIKDNGVKPPIYEKPFRELLCANGTAVNSLRIKQSSRQLVPSYAKVFFSNVHA